MDQGEYDQALAATRGRGRNYTSSSTMRQNIVEGNDVALCDILRLFYRAALANKPGLIGIFVLATLLLLPAIKVYNNAPRWAAQGRGQLREYYDDLALENSWVRRLERDWVSFTTECGRIYLQLTNNWYVDQFRLVCQEIRIIYNNVMSAWWMVFPALLVGLISMCLWKQCCRDIKLTKWEDLPSGIGSGVPGWLREERRTQGSNSHHVAPTGVRYEEWVQSGPMRRYGEVIDILEAEDDIIFPSTKVTTEWQNSEWKIDEETANIIPGTTPTAIPVVTSNIMEPSVTRASSSATEITSSPTTSKMGLLARLWSWQAGTETVFTPSAWTTSSSATAAVLRNTASSTEMSSGTLTSSNVKAASSIPEISNVSEPATRTFVHRSSISPRSDAKHQSDATKQGDDAHSTHIHDDSSSERLSDEEYWGPPKRKTAIDGEELTWCRQCQQFHCCELPY